MGHELYIHLEKPCAGSLAEAMAPVLGPDEFLVESSLRVESPERVAVATRETIDSQWPHCCDLLLETPTRIYALAHNHAGVQIIRRFTDHLLASGLKVEIDDDV
ncbi:MULTISPECIES: hypothetical protein [unclassified Pseudomonas]|uniref:hypothetical protein n=1 Tax=unclassified Pseudomonas TaxID=196821 RepID=UPI00244844CE|nr:MULTISPECIES: hypothetical protein [unclassified Pseudomonas]MDG9929667.1 hypothetical protein [Pseudomonas sp. GD04042]MDH0483442.1 hypothetical protein [Pseudomonas sp. GD04015]MDH0604755.1 hypothetical protein [Pseudomonas sp. GD03869]